MAKTQNTAGSRTKTIKLDKIRLDGDTQSRKELSDEVIKEYARLIEDGCDFPALEVMFDGVDYWLWDGFHRRFAAVKAKLDSFKCNVRSGTREDARWESYAANKNHGFNRGNDDKSKAVKAALLHPNGAKLADNKIAEHVGVSHATVAKYRKQLEATCQIDKSTERTGADGRTINTANIGSTTYHEAEQSREVSGPEVFSEAVENAEDIAFARSPHAFKSEPPEVDFGCRSSEAPKISGGATFDVAEIEAVKEHEATLEGKQEPYDKMLEHLRQVATIWNRLTADEKDGVYVVHKRQRIVSLLGDIRPAIAQARPEAWCNRCDGKGCAKCKNCGWWPKSVVEGMTK